VDATRGTHHNLTVTAPMGNPIVANWGQFGNANTAIIEVAAATGLHLVAKADRNPWHASSQGVGEIIQAVLDCGIRHILIGLGGSATNDGGAGMLAALGARFYDQSGQELPPTPSGLVNLYRLDLNGLDPRISETRIEIACDVTNPLLGAQGASYTFARQKGASDDMIADLDRVLGRFAAAMIPAAGQDFSNCAGAGAAGGIGYALISALHGNLQSGIDLVLDSVEIDRHLDHADLVLTGEGRIDNQTAHGKAISGITRRAHQKQVPVIGLAGTIDYAVVEEAGLQAGFSITPGVISLDNALTNAGKNLSEVARNVARVWRLSRQHTPSLPKDLPNTETTLF